MGVLFWLRRFLLVFSVAFAMIVSAHLLRGHELMYSLSESLLWAMISANIFTASRIYQSRKGIHCALCNDIPGMQNDQ
ncbi:MAG: hypothetical protein ABI644_05785 [Arenimonas sp.]